MRSVFLIFREEHKMDFEVRQRSCKARLPFRCKHCSRVSNNTIVDIAIKWAYLTAVPH